MPRPQHPLAHLEDFLEGRFRLFQAALLGECLAHGKAGGERFRVLAAEHLFLGGQHDGPHRLRFAVAALGDEAVGEIAARLQRFRMLAAQQALARRQHLEPDGLGLRVATLAVEGARELVAGVERFRVIRPQRVDLFGEHAPQLSLGFEVPPLTTDGGDQRVLGAYRVRVAAAQDADLAIENGAQQFLGIAVLADAAERDGHQALGPQGAPIVRAEPAAGDQAGTARDGQRRMVPPFLVEGKHALIEPIHQRVAVVGVVGAEIGAAQVARHRPAHRQPPRLAGGDAGLDLDEHGAVALVAAADDGGDARQAQRAGEARVAFRIHAQAEFVFTQVSCTLGQHRRQPVIEQAEPVDRFLVDLVGWAGLIGVKLAFRLLRRQILDLRVQIGGGQLLALEHELLRVELGLQVLLADLTLDDIKPFPCQLPATPHDKDDTYDDHQEQGELQAGIADPRIHRSPFTDCLGHNRLLALLFFPSGDAATTHSPLRDGCDGRECSIFRGLRNLGSLRASDNWRNSCLAQRRSFERSGPADGRDVCHAQ